MRRMNPDSLMDATKDVGMAGLIALPAAALVGLGAYGASKIDYPVAAGDMLSPAQKRAGVVLLGSLALGVAMQFSKATAGVGKAVAALGVGIPAAMLVQEKVTSMAAPAAAVNPLVAASSGMFIAPSSTYAPQLGYAPSGYPNVGAATSSYVPVR